MSFAQDIYTSSMMKNIYIDNLLTKGFNYRNNKSIIQKYIPSEFVCMYFICLLVIYVEQLLSKSH